MKPILKILLTIALVAATVLATSYLTYRTTMQNIQVEVARDTVYLTVFGQTDEYVIGE
jgi:hypothetical protein